MNDWHLIHLGHLSLSGAAPVTIEATAVSPEERITFAATRPPWVEGGQIAPDQVQGWQTLAPSAVGLAKVRSRPDPETADRHGVRATRFRWQGR
jgi:hypothetical protein